MIRIIKFMGAWILGLFMLQYFIYDKIILKYITNQGAISVLAICLVVPFTIVLAVLVGKK